MYHLMKPDITIIEDHQSDLGTEATEFDDVQLGNLGFSIPGMGGKPKCRGLPNFGTLPFSRGRSLASFKGGGMSGFFSGIVSYIRSGGEFQTFQSPQAFSDPFSFSAYESERSLLNSPGMSLKMGLRPMQTMVKEKLLTTRLDNMQDQVKRQVEGIEYISNRLQAMANWANSGGPTCQKDMDRVVKKIKDWTKAAKSLNTGVERDVKDITKIMEKVQKEGPEIEINVERYEPHDTEFRLAVEGGKIIKKQVTRYKPPSKLFYKKGEGWIENVRYRELGPMGEWDWKGNRISTGGEPTRVAKWVKLGWDVEYGGPVPGQLPFQSPTGAWSRPRREWRYKHGKLAGSWKNIGPSYSMAPKMNAVTTFYEVPGTNPELLTFFSPSLKSPLVVKKQLSKSTEEIESVIAQRVIYGGLLSGTDDKPCCPMLGQLSTQTRSMLGMGAVVAGFIALTFIWR